MINITIDKIEMNAFALCVLANMSKYFCTQFIIKVRLPVLCAPDQVNPYFYERYEDLLNLNLNLFGLKPHSWLAQLSHELKLVAINVATRSLKYPRINQGIVNIDLGFSSSDLINFC